jgi:hypothetical protein
MWWNVAARGVLGNSHDLGVLFEVAEHLFTVRIRDLSVHFRVLDIAVA